MNAWIDEEKLSAPGTAAPDRSRVSGAVRRAPWIALLGVDGSGKSTVLRRLGERQDELPYQGLRVFHRRPRVVYQNAVEPGAPISHYGKPNHGWFKSLVKITAMVMDWNLGYWRKIHSQRSQGYLVIADRHSLLDMLADPDRYRYGGGAAWIRAALQVVPSPGMIVLLDAPAEVLLARKQELTPVKIAHLREKYLEVFEGWPNCLIVDANRPLDEIVSEILLSIEKRFASQG